VKRTLFTIGGMLVGWLLIGTVAGMFFGYFAYNIGLTRDEEFWLNGLVILACLVGGGIVGNRIGGRKRKAAQGWHPQLASQGGQDFERPAASDLLDPEVPNKNTDLLLLWEVCVRILALALCATLVSILSISQFINVDFYDNSETSRSAWSFHGDWIFRSALGSMLIVVLTHAASLFILDKTWRMQNALNVLVAGSSAIAIACVGGQFFHYGSATDLAAFESMRFGWSGWAMIVILAAIPALSVVATSISRQHHRVPKKSHFQSAQPITATRAHPDVAAQLTQLAHLHGHGDLTETEYSAAKKRAIAGESLIAFDHDFAFDNENEAEDREESVTQAHQHQHQQRHFGQGEDGSATTPDPNDWKQICATYGGLGFGTWDESARFGGLDDGRWIAVRSPSTRQHALAFFPDAGEGMIFPADEIFRAEKRASGLNVIAEITMRPHDSPSAMHYVLVAPKNRARKLFKAIGVPF